MTEVEQDRADMRRLQGGDPSALTPVVERWQLRLRTYLMRHGLSDADACDLAQETFVRVYRHAARFDPRRVFSTWMFQIALNLLRDHLRHLARRPQATSSENPIPDPATELSPSRETEGAEIGRAVAAAIARLPTAQREVLVLATYEQLPHEEIAHIVGTSAKGVETRLYRARQTLRQHLAKWL
jgi:RNA polymerase sigma-70 factor (ECF subfamily)